MRYDCAELSDADIDAIVSQAEEETTAEINSFMVAARASVSQPNSFHSRQQRMGAARGKCGSVRVCVRQSSTIFAVELCSALHALVPSSVRPPSCFPRSDSCARLV